MTPVSLCVNPTFGVAGLMLWLFASLATAQPVHKCVSRGAVAYQSSPCRSDGPRRQPTVAELNAQRKIKLQQTAESNASLAQLTAPVPATNQPVHTFKCDGRTRCSQMSSCGEAKYFLANCPGVRMDGDRDGIPCEMQWCK